MKILKVYNGHCINGGHYESLRLRKLNGNDIVDKNAKLSESGMTTVEFALVFPVFFLSLLLVLEISFAMVDRHLESIAAISAARSLILPDHYESTVAIKNLESIKDTIKCQDFFTAKAMNRARRAAAFKMAITAPKASLMMKMVGIPSAPAVENAELKSIARIIDGYPLAYLLTRIGDCKINSDGITLELIYYRNGKFPYAGQALWATYMLSQFNNKAGDKLHAELKDDFMGVGLSSPALDKLQDQVLKSLAQIESESNSIESMTLALTSQFPELASLSTATTSLNQNLMQMKSGIEEKVKKHFDAVNATIKSQELVFTSILYVVPEFLRFIPLKRTVHLSHSHIGFQRQNESGWEKRGFTYFIAPYQSKVSENEQIVKTWESWAKSLATGGLGIE